MQGLICWFCGSYYDKSKLFGGYGIGNMVFSSIYKVSSDQLDYVFNNDIFKHSTIDESRICMSCIEKFYKHIEIDEIYIAMTKGFSDSLFQEMSSYDIGLLRYDDLTFRLGCWFCYYPNLHIRKKFYGLPLGELLDRGLRFSGVVRLNGRELSDFLSKYAEKPSRKHYNKYIFEHIVNFLGIQNMEDAYKMANARSVIYDISIYDICSESEMFRQ